MEVQLDCRAYMFRRFYFGVVWTKKVLLSVERNDVNEQ